MKKLIAKAIYHSIGILAGMAFLVPYIIWAPNFILAHFMTDPTESQFFGMLIMVAFAGFMTLAMLSVPARWVLYKALCFIEKLTKKRNR